jgi:MFS-type transporter involved in bile tolerance (Atg22 family)
MLQSRLGLDETVLQTMTFWLLAETAGITVVFSPVIGHYADKSGAKRIWLLSALVIALISTLGVAVATSRMRRLLYTLIS